MACQKSHSKDVIKLKFKPHSLAQSQHCSLDSLSSLQTFDLALPSAQTPLLPSPPSRNHPKYSLHSLPAGPLKAFTHRKEVMGEGQGVPGTNSLKAEPGPYSFW